MASRPDTVEFRPPPEPPSLRLPPRQWVRENLFSNWYNSLLTMVFTPLLAWVLYRSLRFVFVTARWTIIEVNLTSFMVGRFPRSELWRLWPAMAVAALVIGVGIGIIARSTAEQAAGRGYTLDPSWRERLQRAGPLIALIGGIMWFAQTLLPFVLLAGVVAVGLAAYFVGRRVPRSAVLWVNMALAVGLVVSYRLVAGFDGVAWERWGGILLNAFLTVGGILFAFPLGVLLALGRRSSLPAVRFVCVVFIEVMRGVPLLALIFMSWLILPYFLPRGTPIPGVITRALIAFVLFTAAYVAEIVRGGLQAVPNGQREAAMAVGLSQWRMMRLVVLPQALRSVIPALVGQFISLFKDTTLLFILGTLDALRVARTVTTQPEFLGQGLLPETLVFVSFLFWVGSYWMSKESQRLERRLGVGER